MACLRSFSRRSLYPEWFCYKKTSRPVLLHHHIKDYTESSFPDSSLLIRSFHRQVFFEDRKKMSLVQPMDSSGLLICRHTSSKPEESCSKIDTFGNVVEEVVSGKSVEAMATNVSSIDECNAAIENFSFPGDLVHYVINGIHELTGFNWWMSIVLTAFLVSVLMSPVSMRALLWTHKIKMLATILFLRCLSLCSGDTVFYVAKLIVLYFLARSGYCGDMVKISIMIKLLRTIGF